MPAHDADRRIDLLVGGGLGMTVVTSPVSSFTVLVVNASPIGFSTDLTVTLVVGSVRAGAATL
jgi:hypothetical protein